MCCITRSSACAHAVSTGATLSKPLPRGRGRVATPRRPAVGKRESARGDLENLFPGGVLAVLSASRRQPSMPKVLIFESDTRFADELRRGLEQQSCAVTVVGDATEGLQLAANNRPDLILLT